VTPTGEFVAESSHSEDLFGVSLALNSETVLVGVRDRDGSKDGETGLAYVFEYADDQWRQQAAFLADYPDNNDGITGSVAIDSERAIVFATPEHNETPRPGYVFERSGGDWSQQITLTRESGPAREGSSGPVALDGDTALVLGHSDRNGWSGYVFQQVGGAWRQQDRFVPTDGKPEDSNVNLMTLDGDTAVIGVSFDTNVNGEDAGAAYVFTRSDGQWSQQAKLLPEDGSAKDWFGNSVALDGRTALAGAGDGRYRGTHSGAAYVFERSGGEWTQQAKLGLTNGESGQVFGSSVALAGETALVGAPRYPQWNGCGRIADTMGAAHVFKRSEGEWRRTAKLIPSDGTGLNEFGNHVALTEDTALVGTATTCYDRERDAVYVFSLENSLDR